jgi:hypothetical protein
MAARTRRDCQKLPKGPEEIAKIAEIAKKSKLKG